MATEQHDGKVRGRVFGEVAEVYDAARPGYADALVDEVLAYADLGDRPAVEVGAGTGKATVPFAARGVPLVCVEPDLRMAEVLRRNTAAYPGVRIEVGGFEDWQPGGRRHGLLLAASCWHWLDPQRRWDLVHAALAPGGAVALFWNGHAVLDPALHAELAEADNRAGIANSPHHEPASAHPKETDWAEETGWPEGECRRDGRFTDLRSTRFRQKTRYDTARYVGYLTSVSAYRILPDGVRERALDDVARILDAHGGGIGMDSESALFLARAR